MHLVTVRDPVIQVAILQEHHALLDLGLEHDRQGTNLVEVNEKFGKIRPKGIVAVNADFQ